MTENRVVLIMHRHGMNVMENRNELLVTKINFNGGEYNMPLNFIIIKYIQAILIIGIFVFLTGCASNNVSSNKWWSKTRLIDHEGNISEGRTVFRWGYRDGTIKMPGTRYGNLEGRLYIQTHSMQLYKSGTVVENRSDKTQGHAYLITKRKVALKCDIEAEFKTQRIDGVQMIGEGVCVDKDGNLLNIIFGG